jgi:hypothetical protein
VDSSGDNLDNLSRATNLGITGKPLSVSFWVNLSTSSTQGAFFCLGSTGDKIVTGYDGNGKCVGVGSVTFESTGNV